MAEEDPSLLRVFRGHRGSVTSVAFCGGGARPGAVAAPPGEPRLVTGSLDGCVMVWHAQQHVRAFRYIGHSDAVNAVAYDAVNNLVASASSDKTVRLWRPTAEGRSTVLKAHTAAVRCCAFAPSGRLLATASDDKSVKVWSVPQQSFLCSLTGHTNWVRSCGLSPDARLAVSGGDDHSVRVWDLETRAALHSFDEPEGSVNMTRFHPDGSCIATGGSDGSVKLWDLRAGRLVQYYEAHAAAVTDLAFHPGGTFLMSSSTDGTLKVLDLAEGSIFYTLHGHEGPALGVAFSAAGDQFASAGADKAVLVWRTNFDAALASAVEGVAARGAGTGSGDRPAGKQQPAPWRPGGQRAGAVGPEAAASARPKTAPVQQLGLADADSIPAVRPARSQLQDGSHAAFESASLNTGELPSSVADVLQTLVTSLDALTQTVAAMEERLTIQEDRGRRMELALAQLSAERQGHQAPAAVPARQAPEAAALAAAEGPTGHHAAAEAGEGLA